MPIAERILHGRYRLEHIKTYDTSRLILDRPRSDCNSKGRCRLFDEKSLREPLITYLRDLEDMARAECDRRQMTQIIASGRNLLGDRKYLGRKSDLITHRL